MTLAADIGDNLANLARWCPAPQHATAPRWCNFVEKVQGDATLCRTAERLGFSESTLRGQINAEPPRSPPLDDVLERFARWPASIRQQLVDLFFPAELAESPNTDFNDDGRRDLDDALDAMIANGALGQATVQQLRQLCRHPVLATNEQLASLIPALRKQRGVLNTAIAVLQQEQLRRQRRRGR